MIKSEKHRWSIFQLQHVLKEVKKMYNDDYIMGMIEGLSAFLPVKVFESPENGEKFTPDMV